MFVSGVTQGVPDTARPPPNCRSTPGPQCQNCGIAAAAAVSLSLSLVSLAQGALQNVWLAKQTLTWSQTAPACGKAQVLQKKIMQVLRGAG